MTDGELPTGDLQSVRAISAPTISRHLKILRTAGIITQRIDKQRRRGAPSRTRQSATGNVDRHF